MITDKILKGIRIYPYITLVVEFLVLLLFKTDLRHLASIIVVTILCAYNLAQAMLYLYCRDTIYGDPKVEVKQHLITKLAHTPAVVLCLLLFAAFKSYNTVIPIEVYTIIPIATFMYVSGLLGVSSVLNGRQIVGQTKAVMLLYCLLQFVPILDVITTIQLYSKVYKKHKPKVNV